MREEICKKNKVSWPKTLKRWFSVKSKAAHFHADDFSSKDDLKERSSKQTDLDAAQVRDVNNYRIFVATWNVAGKSPAEGMNLEEWLHTWPPANIYVLGFQEIVPLNAGNVLGTEDDGPARKWLALIKKSLNSLPVTTSGFQTPSPVPDPVIELDSDFEGSTRQRSSSFFQRRSFRSFNSSMSVTGSELRPQLDRRYSIYDRAMFENRLTEYKACSRWGGGSSDEDDGMDDSPSNSQIPFLMDDKDKPIVNSRYCLVASRQMVGIYLTIWVKDDLRDVVRNMKVSCVGRGLMGYLGNKGSIAISMSLHQTSFCFICSHLTSGQKEGDELRRNLDVMEILRKTRFPRVQQMGDENSPQTILEHDRIIWLGDLNYRIALSYRVAKALVEMQNWRALLDNDQLRIEQIRGRAFQGWNEGKIYFPPTYKYSNNSDQYACDDMHPKEKRRTPAWCDRILWYGQGLHQLSYVRGESRFSDHRPVYSIFLAEILAKECDMDEDIKFFKKKAPVYQNDQYLIDAKPKVFDVLR